MQIVSDNIVRLMAERDLNAAELARRAKVNPTGIYDILSGKSRSPRLDTIVKIAGALGVQPIDLMQPASAVGRADPRSELLEIFVQLPPSERHRLLQAARAWLPGADTA